MQDTAEVECFYPSFWRAAALRELRVFGSGRWLTGLLAGRWSDCRKWGFVCFYPVNLTAARFVTRAFIRVFDSSEYAGYS